MPGEFKSAAGVMGGETDDGRREEGINRKCRFVVTRC